MTTFTAQATTNAQGNIVYSQDFDLDNLKPAEIGNKQDVWFTEISSKEAATIEDLINGAEQPANNNTPFNALAFHVLNQENNGKAYVNFGRNGGVKEIITNTARYRSRGYDIYTKKRKGTNY